MFGDIGWTELLLIGIVALVVIGPEDLPGMFRQIGRFTAKLRQMSREFSRAMEQAAKETGVKDVAKDLKAAASPMSFGAGSLGLNKVKEAADRFEKWDPLANATKPVAAQPLVPPPMPATPVAHPDMKITPAVAAAPLGPATQELVDKQAARKAILADTAARMKAVDAPASDLAGNADPKPRATPKPRAAAMSAAAAAADPVAPKPRAPRKTKKADEA